MKKRLLTILLAIAMLATICASMTFTVSAAGNNPYICVPLAGGDITIDGQKDATYDKAAKISLGRVLTKGDQLSGLDADAYLMWGNDQKIYIYVDVKDADVALSKNLPKDIDPSNSDCVEFYAYWGNGEQILMYRMTRDGVLYCRQPAHQGDTYLVDESGDASEHFEAAVVEKDGGYAVEMKINTYLANLCEGALISYKFVVASTDEAATYFQTNSNFGCAYNANRLHKKPSTAPQTYANMMLVNADGANVEFHKYPTLSPDNLDAKRYNKDKVEQKLNLRSATFINDQEIVVKFSKACTLQWFNNAPVFMGVCDVPFPAPLAQYEEGKSWQIGCDLSSAVTNDGGVTWKLKLDKPLPKNANGSYATGVFRVSETQGLDESFYLSNNDFIGHVISLDGQDYLYASNSVGKTGDSWDVTSVTYEMNTKLAWDSSKEEPLKVIPNDTTLGEIVDNMPFLTANPMGVDEEGEDEDNKGTDDKKEDEKNPDDNKEKDPTKKDDGESNFLADYWWVLVIAAVVVVAVVVVVILASKKKKK